MENNRSFLSEPGAAAMDQDQAPSPSDENLDFDEDTLKGYDNESMAKVYLEEGDKEDGLKEPLNAIYFYTEGLQVSWSYQEALNDATAAVKLEPTLIKAIETGASACVQLQCYEDAITWCDKGLALPKNGFQCEESVSTQYELCSEPKRKPRTVEWIVSNLTLKQIDKDNDTLLDLCAKGSSHQSELQESKQSKLKCEPDTNAVKDQQIEASAPKDDSEEVWYSDDVNANDSLADLNDAAQYLGIDLSSLGNYYYNLEDFKKAIQYHERDLNMANEVGDKAREGRAYANLGNAYDSLGDFRKAIDYHECHLKVAKELQDRAGEGRANARLGNTYDSMGDFKKAIEYHECHLKIAKEVGDKAGEGMAYSNLGNAFESLGDLKKAIEYYEHHLKFAKELGDRGAEGFAYSNLGNVYQSLRDFHEAISYHERHLTIAKEIEDTIGEELAYTHLGNAYDSLEDFKTASEYYESHLKIAQEVGDRYGEGCAYANLGNAHNSLGDFKQAIEYYKCELKIAKEIGDSAGEGRAYANLGNASHSLGDFRKAIDYHGSHLKNAKEVGDRAGEGCAYGNLGNAYNRLGDFQKAIECHERRLMIAKEVGDRVGEGRAYANLGNAYHSLEDFKKSIEYHELHLKIAVNVGDRAEEGRAYGSLGNAYDSLGDFKKAIEYFQSDLQIAKEVGGSAEKAKSFFNLGQSLESKGLLNEAHDCYYSIVKMLNEVRQRLLFKDEWNISYRHFHSYAYTYLWRLLLKQGEEVKALLAAEQGRAQALQDLLNSKYATKTEETIFDTFSCLPSNTVFMALEEGEMIFWIIQNGNVQLRRKKIVEDSLEDVAIAVAQSLINNAFKKIGVRGVVKCEDRSLVRIIDDDMSNKRSPPTISQPTHFDTNPLRVLYDIIISPISDFIHGSELTFVPEGSLCLAPYAAFMDSHLKYLCDYFKIRLLPSLSTFKLMADCSADYHLKYGALLVGDPCLEEVIYQGRKLIQLPSARQEVEMIGEILDIAPLTGKEATKDEVLRRLPSVALVHIAAHGSMETGEIALAPNITRASKTPVEEDYLLTMKDVLSSQLRARLVVLSCCHSARGEIKAEGVVGIARAFLGAGARSVLVSLWAIDDEATLEFMQSFYSHLAERRSASEALNRAMKRMRDSDNFREVKYWAPFVLIGDDVTLDLAKGH